jgi:acylphosphatase
MTHARRFLISGRVQGVGYRFFAREAAAVEGLRGRARNLDDGTVEVIAEGDEDAIARFERALRRGPISARVEQVVVEPMFPSGRFNDFRIS